MRGPGALKLDSIAMPSAASGQVMPHVRAAGINGLDWKMPEIAAQMPPGKRGIWFRIWPDAAQLVLF
jgi:NADPH:quinone reductase-like Zn-dependent oxidoreductase